MKRIIFSIAALLLIGISGYSQELTGKQVIEKADALQRGETNEGEMSMTIIRPKWERTINMKSWSKGTEYSMTYITSPVKDKGQVFLKRKSEMWNWVPTINRMIKLPPSMMSQGWMGSDYSNDDILKESSIVVDYIHKIVGNDIIEGLECYKIELIPKEDAAVVWGKIITNIDTTTYTSNKDTFYDEDGEEVRYFLYDKVKKIGKYYTPTVWRIQSVDKKEKYTEIILEDIKYDTEISKEYFKKSALKRFSR